MASTVEIFARCFANDIATMLGVTVLYKLVFSPALWSGIVSLWRPWSDVAFTMVATFAVHEVMYFGVNSLFLWVAKLGWLSKYKIYRGPTQEPSADLLKRTIKENLIGHGVTQWIGLYVLAKGFEKNGASLDDDLPDFWTAYVQLFVSLAVLKAGFYWTHRLFHSKYFYAKYHKQHHEYAGTIGFAAEYAHPLEQIISNQLPTVAGMLIMRGHVTLWLTWLVWRLWQTYESHSGFALPFPFHGEQTRYHDYHHSHNLETYAADPVWDIIGGTYHHYAKFIQENPTIQDEYRNAKQKGK